MKFSVNELSGARLDQAVAKACGNLYDAEIDEDFIVIAFDPVLPRPPDRHIRRSVCRIAVDLDGQPYTTTTAWAAGSSAKGRTNAFCPSSDWAHGGPIIEREKITVFHDAWWEAGLLAELSCSYGAPSLEMNCKSRGETALIAAMRAFVCARLGNTVEL